MNIRPTLSATAAGFAMLALAISAVLGLAYRKVRS